MIIVYSQPDCQPCKMAIKMLDDAGVDYIVNDISQCIMCKEYVTEDLGAKSTPVIHRMGEATDVNIIGFKPDEIKAMIERESAPTVYGDGTWMH